MALEKDAGLGTAGDEGDPTFTAGAPLCREDNPGGSPLAVEGANQTRLSRKLQPGQPAATTAVAEAREAPRRRRAPLISRKVR